MSNLPINLEVQPANRPLSEESTSQSDEGRKRSASPAEPTFLEMADALGEKNLVLLSQRKDSSFDNRKQTIKREEIAEEHLEDALLKMDMCLGSPLNFAGMPSSWREWPGDS
ncbi:uncharacterized protein BP5553_04248 [Venustampulla echinocandica]|uniref:Uncharacterized protein n=1 Tax=Venustampulla echinocandica TaxID=2656787 RepID=A0A370TWQ9_9HELO|nr:uncharacterized protein BP5553_04248 [Venustampulla echinocandica]RDL39908.1 hypothetical protein BP5553_04248 [Venustampulla echinocandica]